MGEIIKLATGDNKKHYEMKKMFMEKKLHGEKSPHFKHMDRKAITEIAQGFLEATRVG